MINDSAVSAGIAENRRHTPTHPHTHTIARAQRRRSVINRFRPTGKVHTVLSIKRGPRLFPSPLRSGLFTHRRRSLPPPLARSHAAAVCRANYSDPASVASPSPLIPHTRLYTFTFCLPLFPSLSLSLCLSLSLSLDNFRYPSSFTRVPTSSRRIILQCPMYT